MIKFEIYINICFITADKKGYAITKKRIVNDMGFKLYYVNVLGRAQWIDKKFNLKKTIYMGDSIFDSIALQKVAYGIAPKNADKYAKKSSKHITTASGGDRAVSEACVFILKKFFKINFFKLLKWFIFLYLKKIVSVIASLFVSIGYRW